ncbi:MAG TPA: hypothetical protein VGH75_02310 [Steroidobacteraceae bacterium]|jgi:hypothetical protein
MIAPVIVVSDSGELFRVSEEAPERLARGQYGTRQCGISILEQTDYFHQQQLVLLAKLAEGTPRLALMKRLELRQQSIYLILQRQLGKYTDRARIAQALFEPVQIE